MIVVLQTLAYLPPPSIRGEPMKQTKGIELPASFVVTVSLAGAEISPALAADNDILTVAEVAEILKCKQSSIYNLTRNRGKARYDNPIPVLKLPMGLRFRRSSVLAWLKSQERTSPA
jgi:predicted DNA-binding transcriptional regulator AlpA